MNFILSNGVHIPAIGMGTYPMNGQILCNAVQSAYSAGYRLFDTADNYYNENDDKQMWFDRIKELAGELGYAREVKEFKANPDAYKAHVGDVSTVLRVALTGRTNTPDMYEIVQVLGKEVVTKRLEKAMR